MGEAMSGYRIAITSIVAVATMAAIVFLSVPSRAAGVKPGRWEFTSQIQGMQMPQLPPGVQLPPNIHMGNGGTTYTTCITGDNPVPTNGHQSCTLDNMSRSGDTVSWQSTCRTPRGVMHGTGQATYSGDTMHSTMTIDGDGGAMHMTQVTSGRYLGPCTAR